MPALIPLALSLAPEIATWLFGPKAEQTATTVAAAIATATGTTDASAQTAVLERDPQVAATLRIALAKIAAAAAEERAASLSELTAHLHDTADARAQTVALATNGSTIAWSAPIISLAVLSTFAGVMYLALTRALPSGSEPTLNLMLGSLAAMASAVVSYWVGSSAGSARKEDHIAALTSVAVAPQRPR